MTLVEIKLMKHFSYKTSINLNILVRKYILSGTKKHISKN